MRVENALQLIILCIISIQGQMIAEGYKGYHSDFFFAREPSARSEAMGRSLVAIYNNGFSTFYNPAALITARDVNFSFSRASPYYVLEEANYTHFGLSYNINQIGAIGASLFHYSTGDESIATDTLGNEIDRLTPSSKLYTVSFARKIIHDFAIGINLNYFEDIVLTDKKFTAFPIDISILKILKVGQSTRSRQSLNLGAMIKNVLNSSATLDNAEEILPVFLRIGSAYEFKMNKLNSNEIYVLNIILTLEYQNILNAEKDIKTRFHGDRSGFKFGGEISIYELFLLRTGYYSEDIKNSLTNGKSKISDFTYGLGLQIPFKKFTKAQLPVLLKFDFTSLKQPSYATGLDELDRFTILSLNLSWRL